MSRTIFQRIFGAPSARPLIESPGQEAVGPPNVMVRSIPSPASRNSENDRFVTIP